MLKYVKFMQCIAAVFWQTFGCMGSFKLLLCYNLKPNFWSAGVFFLIHILDIFVLSSFLSLKLAKAHSTAIQLLPHHGRMRQAGVFVCFFTHIMVTFVATTGTSSSRVLSQSSSRSRHWHSSGTTPSTGEVTRIGTGMRASFRLSSWVYRCQGCSSIYTC